MENRTKIQEVRTLNDEQVALMILSITSMLINDKSKRNERIVEILKYHMDCLDMDSKDVAAAKLINELEGIKYGTN